MSVGLPRPGGDLPTKYIGEGDPAPAGLSLGQSVIVTDTGDDTGTVIETLEWDGTQLVSTDKPDYPQYLCLPSVTPVNEPFADATLGSNAYYSPEGALPEHLALDNVDAVAPVGVENTWFELDIINHVYSAGDIYNLDFLARREGGSEYSHWFIDIYSGGSIRARIGQGGTFTVTNDPAINPVTDPDEWVIPLDFTFRAKSLSFSLPEIPGLNGSTFSVRFQSSGTGETSTRSWTYLFADFVWGAISPVVGPLPTYINTDNYTYVNQTFPADVRTHDALIADGGEPCHINEGAPHVASVDLASSPGLGIPGQHLFVPNLSAATEIYVWADGWQLIWSTSGGSTLPSYLCLIGTVPNFVNGDFSDTLNGWTVEGDHVTHELATNSSNYSGVDAARLDGWLGTPPAFLPQSISQSVATYSGVGQSIGYTNIYSAWFGQDPGEFVVELVAGTTVVATSPSYLATTSPQVATGTLTTDASGTPGDPLWIRWGLSSGRSVVIGDIELTNISGPADTETVYKLSREAAGADDQAYSNQDNPVDLKSYNELDVLGATACDNASQSTTTATDWASAGTTVITALTTDPVKATVTELDVMRYRLLPFQWIEVEMIYTAADATGATTGSGDYVFALPSGYAIDTSYPRQNIVNGTVSSPWTATGTAIPNSTLRTSEGYVKQSSAYATIAPLPFTTTSVRMVTRAGTSGNNVIRSNHFQLAVNGKAMYVRFEYKYV